MALGVLGASFTAVTFSHSCFSGSPGNPLNPKTLNRGELGARRGQGLRERKESSASGSAHEHLREKQGII